jgi:hypothetical protein
VRTPDGATHSLDDTGKLPFGHDPKDFGVKGAYYYPECFHVVDGCTCGFYTSVYPNAFKYFCRNQSMSAEYPIGIQPSL